MHVGRFVAVFGSNFCWQVQVAWSVLDMGRKPPVSQKVKGEPQRKNEKRSRKDKKNRAVTSMDSDSDSGASCSRETMAPPFFASRPSAAKLPCCQTRVLPAALLRPSIGSNTRPCTTVMARS